MRNGTHKQTKRYTTENNRPSQKAFDQPPIEFVPNTQFDEPGIEEKLWGAAGDSIHVAQYRLLTVVEEDLMSCRDARRTVLKPAHERTLFLRYNYAKSRLHALLEQGRRPTTRQREETELWHRRASEARDNIVHANLPLVPSMARRALTRHVEFCEMISEGHMALLRSVEKFDVARGFKFSTYACRAILACFYRMAAKAQTYRRHVPMQIEAGMDRDDFLDTLHEYRHTQAAEAVQDVMRSNRAGLTEMETRIIRGRFPPLQADKSATLNDLGKALGLSSERVRQIERAALKKIGQAVMEELVV